MRNNKVKIFQIAVHVGSLIPFVILIWDYYNSNLTINPIQEATLRTGKTALILLTLSLTCTPLNMLSGAKFLIRARRPLGVYAFMYATIHFLIFIGIDYGFNWGYIKEALFEKRFALAGFSAYLILLPLAITSTKGWQKRLKKRWKSLHKLVYLAGIIVVVHYAWLVKSDIREPLVYGAIIFLLLIARIPVFRRWLSQLRFRNARA